MSNGKGLLGRLIFDAERLFWQSQGVFDPKETVSAHWGRHYYEAGLAESPAAGLERFHEDLIRLGAGLLGPGFGEAADLSYVGVLGPSVWPAVTPGLPHPTAHALLDPRLRQLARSRKMVTDYGAIPGYDPLYYPDPDALEAGAITAQVATLGPRISPIDSLETGAIARQVATLGPRNGGPLALPPAVAPPAALGGVGGLPVASRTWSTGTTQFARVGRRYFVLTRHGWKSYRPYKPVALGKRLPTKAQFKRINKRLHDWGTVARGILSRMGYSFGGSRRRYRRRYTRRYRGRSRR